MSDEQSKHSQGVEVMGPHIKALETIAHQSERMELCALGRDGTGARELKVTLKGPGNAVCVQVDSRVQMYARSIGAGLIDLNAICRNLVLESIVAKGSKSPVSGKELRRLAIAAWCEAAGMAIPSDEQMEQLLSSKVIKPEPKRDPRKALIEKIRADGASPASVLNSLTQPEACEIKHIRKADLSKLNLDGARLWAFDMESCNFDDASMCNANLKNCNFKRAFFRRTNLQYANLSHMRCLEADFSGADLSHARLTGAALIDANFSNVNFTNADLSHADLRGTDLTGADLTGVILERTGFDENTKLPGDFGFPSGLRWLGSGIDPAMVQQIKSTVAAGGAVSFDVFLDRLKSSFDQDRVKKALKMLQAERFQLFSEVKPDSVVGIVKSQTNADLVYSCRLTEKGQFCCCTQNLFPCGGLRGALCKHLLVLLIGLTRAGELDPTSACAWIVTSAMQKPALDKNSASETFLRYKGAEAGEIDWRPTETMPEDYYAF